MHALSVLVGKETNVTSGHNIGFEQSLSAESTYSDTEASVQHAINASVLSASTFDKNPDESAAILAISKSRQKAIEYSSSSTFAVVLPTPAISLIKSSILAASISKIVPVSMQGKITITSYFSKQSKQERPSAPITTTESTVSIISMTKPVSSPSIDTSSSTYSQSKVEKNTSTPNAPPFTTGITSSRSERTSQIDTRQGPHVTTRATPVPSAGEITSTLPRLKVYFTSWAKYGANPFNVPNLIPFLDYVPDIMYAFIGLEEVNGNWVVNLLDPWADKDVLSLLRKSKLTDLGQRRPLSYSAIY